jgi:hypothetical protein
MEATETSPFFVRPSVPAADRIRLAFSLESETHKALTPEGIAECRQHLWIAFEEQKVHERPAQSFTFERRV